MHVSMLLLMISTTGSACGESTPPDMPMTPREVIADTVVLQTGDLAEAMLLGGPGDIAKIEIDAPVAKLDWNIHGHANNETTLIEEELGVMVVRYTFEPPARAAWNLLLRNRDAAELTVQIRVELFGDMTWSSE
jgi:hypothetical protein